MVSCEIIGTAARCRQQLGRTEVEARAIRSFPNAMSRLRAEGTVLLAVVDVEFPHRLEELLMRIDDMNE